MLFSRFLYYFTSVFTLLRGIQNWPQVVALFLGRPVPRPFVVTLRNGLRFQVRTPMDVWILKETVLDRCSERYGVPVGEGWTIVDVGAGIGDFAILAARVSPRNRVFAFEPFPESLALCLENLRLNGVTNVVPLAQAIGGASGALTLDLSAPEPVQIGTAQDAAEQTVTVPALSLAEALAQLPIERCDLLKLDCEGAEFPILLQAPERTLRQIDRIVMEVHDSPEHRRQELVDLLTRAGFQVRTASNPVHRHLGFLYAGRMAPVTGGGQRTGL